MLSYVFVFVYLTRPKVFNISDRSKMKVMMVDYVI